MAADLAMRLEGLTGAEKNGEHGEKGLSHG